jgi:hypothetical protein
VVYPNKDSKNGINELVMTVDKIPAKKEKKEAVKIEIHGVSRYPSELTISKARTVNAAKAPLIDPHLNRSERLRQSPTNSIAAAQRTKTKIEYLRSCSRIKILRLEASRVNV